MTDFQRNIVLCLVKRFKFRAMTKNDQKWPNMTKNDQKWPKVWFLYQLNPHVFFSFIGFIGFIVVSFQVQWLVEATCPAWPLGQMMINHWFSCLWIFLIWPKFGRNIQLRWWLMKYLKSKCPLWSSVFLIPLKYSDNSTFALVKKQQS